MTRSKILNPLTEFRHAVIYLLQVINVMEIMPTYRFPNSPAVRSAGNTTETDLPLAEVPMDHIMN